MIGRLMCFLRRSHSWRRARKAEDQALKFCQRCGASVAVKKRAKAAV